MNSKKTEIADQIKEEVTSQLTKIASVRSPSKESVTSPTRKVSRPRPKTAKPVTKDHESVAKLIHENNYLVDQGPKITLIGENDLKSPQKSAVGPAVRSTKSAQKSAVLSERRNSNTIVSSPFDNKPAKVASQWEERRKTLQHPTLD